MENTILGYFAPIRIKYSLVDKLLSESVSSVNNLDCDLTKYLERDLSQS